MSGHLQKQEHHQEVVKFVTQTIVGCGYKFTQSQDHTEVLQSAPLTAAQAVDCSKRLQPLASYNSMRVPIVSEIPNGTSRKLIFINLSILPLPKETISTMTGRIAISSQVGEPKRERARQVPGAVTPATPSPTPASVGTPTPKPLLPASPSVPKSPPVASAPVPKLVAPISAPDSRFVQKKATYNPDTGEYTVTFQKNPAAENKPQPPGKSRVGTPSQPLPRAPLGKIAPTSSTPPASPSVPQPSVIARHISAPPSGDPARKSNNLLTVPVDNVVRETPPLRPASPGSEPPSYSIVEGTPDPLESPNPNPAPGKFFATPASENKEKEKDNKGVVSSMVIRRGQGQQEPHRRIKDEELDSYDLKPSAPAKFIEAKKAPISNFFTRQMRMEAGAAAILRSSVRISQGKAADKALNLFSIIERGDTEALKPFLKPEKSFLKKSNTVDYWNHAISPLTYAAILLGASLVLDPASVPRRREIFSKLAQIASPTALKQVSLFYSALEQTDQKLLQQIWSKQRIQFDKQTPLMNAITKGDINQVQDLLSRYPQSVSEQHNSLNALDYAVAYGNDKLLKIVLEHGVYNSLSGITREHMDKAMLLSEATSHEHVQEIMSTAYDRISKRLSLPNEGERPSPFAPGGSTC